MKVYTANMEIGLMAMTIGLSMASCVDPFVAESVDFNSAIVIEATITDENKKQEILLSRTFALDTTGIYGERGAEVKVTDTNGTVYSFLEAEEGSYISNVSFAAQAGLGYTLSVITNDGSTYSSDEVIAPQPTQIDRLYAERDFKDGEVNEGLFIYVDSEEPTGSNNYYRYEYEETYKIIAPYWHPNELYVDPSTGLVSDKPRLREEQVCYNTILSTSINQLSTQGFNENKISKFPIRFIEKENYILTHRYSILVKQLIQSRQSYKYYETLKSLSDSECLFSQIQTGFLEGNIKSNNRGQVIGFFDVSAVSKTRMYLAYNDFYPCERIPNYLTDCQLFSVELIPANIEFDSEEMFDYYDPILNPLNFDAPGDYLLTFNACSDCTVFGSNVKPDFWVD